MNQYNHNPMVLMYILWLNNARGSKTIMDTDKKLRGT